MYADGEHSPDSLVKKPLESQARVLSREYTTEVTAEPLSVDKAERNENYCLCWTLWNSQPSYLPIQIAFQISLLLVPSLSPQTCLFITHPLPQRNVEFRASHPACPGNQVFPHTPSPHI